MSGSRQEVHRYSEWSDAGKRRRSVHQNVRVGSLIFEVWEGFLPGTDGATWPSTSATARPIACRGFGRC